MIRETPVPGLLLAEEERPDLLLARCGSGFRAVILFDAPTDRLGRRTCDFGDAALIGCSAASRTGGLPSRCARFAAFDPELLRPGSGDGAGEYGWFGYRPAEALHLSAEERRIVAGCFDDLLREASRKSDRYCRCILSRLIHRMLDYVSRFYERQFITRELENRRLLADHRAFLDRYLSSGLAPLRGAPDPALCADRLHLSEACFTDLLRFETGHTPESYFQSARLDMARWMLRNSTEPVGRIAAELGFSSVCGFSYLFRKTTGLSPEAYRHRP